MNRNAGSRAYLHYNGRKNYKKNELKPFQKEQWVIPAEKSAAFVCQMERVLDVYQREYDPMYPVVCKDESPKQIIDYKKFIGQDGKHYQDSEYIRKGVAELFIAFEPLAGYREMSVEDDHKAYTWVYFIARLMDTIYKNAKMVTWVMDNFSTHKPENFYAVFPAQTAKAYLDRMNFVYTPKHGSWLNMAEIEFSVITRQEFDRPFADKEDVKKVVLKWVNKRNQNKKGANWQFKTKDARVKLAKLYPTL
ncbi:IS630 family transposase [Emticicia agri]|uniref:IS630 family transposase n=1 Tax=Emticicia agri TaxID=2492393 RepID=A0A4Q5LUL6_9BACT|nr:IS630 family transposase [Emticicia agri]RYU93189.1 IS630 family transposase [Emticicia agri]